MAAVSNITSTLAPGFAIGPNGSTNPVLQADCSVSSAATGLKVIGRAAAAGADIIVASSGTNENLKIDAKGSGTVAINTTGTGAITLGAATGVTGAITGTSASASALTVGPNGATNPTLKVDGSTASAATGLQVKSAAAAAGLALSVVSSGTNENLTVDAKGSGTITLGGTSTGAITLTRAVTASAAVTAASSVLSTSATAGIGYATGAGGAVTQATSRTTGVTLNTITGAITTNTASLAAAAAATFTVTNSAVAVTDVIHMSIRSGATTVFTTARVTAVAAGSFDITIQNTHASTAETGAIIVNFVVIKGVAA